MACLKQHPSRKLSSFASKMPGEDLERSPSHSVCRGRSGVMQLSLSPRLEALNPAAQACARGRKPAPGILLFRLIGAIPGKKVSGWSSQFPPVSDGLWHRAITWMVAGCMLCFTP